MYSVTMFTKSAKRPRSLPHDGKKYHKMKIGLTYFVLVIILKNKKSTIKVCDNRRRAAKTV